MHFIFFTEIKAVIKHEITVDNKSAPNDWVILLQVRNDGLLINMWSALKVL